MTVSQGLLATEAECAAGRTAPRVSLTDIEANIIGEYSFTAAQAVTGRDDASGSTPIFPVMETLTIVLLVTRNGFTVIGKSAPASPENFDPDLGRKLAKEDAIRQLWPLMGYALRDRLWLDSEDTAQFDRAVAA